MTLHTELRIAPRLRERQEQHGHQQRERQRQGKRKKKEHWFMIGSARAKVRMDCGTTLGKAKTKLTAWNRMRTTMSRNGQTVSAIFHMCGWDACKPRQESP